MAVLRIRDRALDVTEAGLALILRRSPPLLRMDVLVRATDGDWEAKVETASFLAVPAGPFGGGDAVTLDVPDRNVEENSLNFKLYVFEHAAIRGARLELTPVGPLRTRLRVTGRSDLWPVGADDRNVPVELEIELPVTEVSAIDARDEVGLRAALAEAGIPVPPTARFGDKYGSVRMFLPG